jgi:hypothetical protein
MEINILHKMLIQHIGRLRHAGIVLIAVCILGFLLLSSQQTKLETPFIPYLGQNPPGSSPELFAEGIIPADLHTVPVFSSDLHSMYYKSMNADGIMLIRFGNEGWMDAEPLFDKDLMLDSDDPCFFPGTDKLFFSAYNKEENREFIYSCSIDDESFSSPQMPEGDINQLDHHWQFSIASNGNIYYASNGNLYLSEYKNNKYLKAIKLDSNINTNVSECTPYINAEENMLLFSRSENGKPDLFVSHKDDDGKWLPAKKLENNINTEHHEMCPRISPDGKYLFFISSRAGLFSAYWVDVEVLEMKDNSL